MKLVAVVLVVWPLPKSQNRFVIVPNDASVNVTAKGAAPINGVAEKAATGAEASPQQLGASNATVSTNQPAAPILASEPRRHLNWTDWPTAANGRFTIVVMKPADEPLQPERPVSGLAVPV